MQRNDVVKIINPKNQRFGEVGRVVAIDETRPFPYAVSLEGHTYWFTLNDLTLISPARLQPISV
jgi:hypothetical protein